MLILYSTLGCHLCDLAIAVAQPHMSNGLSLEVIDIAEDTSLIEQYGVRIPVVQHKRTGAEIGWPFDESEFLTWLAQQAGSA